MAKNEVRYNLKDWEAIKARAKELEGMGVKVGVLASRGGNAPHGDDGITMIELAAIHEFGSPAAKIPERSFIRAGIERNRAELVKLQAAIATRLLAGKLTPENAFRLLGEWAVAKIRAYITEGAGVPPPLKPATIARKDSSRPLVDTGRLLQAITYEVTKGDTEPEGAPTPGGAP